MRMALETPHTFAMGAVRCRILVPEIFAMDMERIFAKTWILLAHDLEIPASGDFMVRDLG